MTAKEYLSGLKALDVKINRKLEKISVLRALLTSIPAVNTDEEKVQGNGTFKDPRFVKILAEIDELETEVNNDIDIFVDERRKIINQIYRLDNDLYRKILYKRYIEFKNFSSISADINRTYRYTLTVHKQALKKFENIMPIKR